MDPLKASFNQSNQSLALLTGSLIVDGGQRISSLINSLHEHQLQSQQDSRFIEQQSRVEEPEYADLPEVEDMANSSLETVEKAEKQDSSFVN